MNKKIVAPLLAAAILASVQLAEAQKRGRVPTVGYLIPAAGVSAQYEAFRQGLRDLGYVEGQNVVIEYRSGEGSARLANLATELAQLQVDVIVAQGARPLRPRRPPEQFPLFSELVVTRWRAA